MKKVYKTSKVKDGKDIQENTKNLNGLFLKDKYIWLIFFIALFIRFAYYFISSKEPWLNFPIMDDHYYHTWANDIVNGDWLSKSQGVFFLSPGYPYFVALIYALFGRVQQSVIFIQYIIGAFICVIIYLLSLKLINNKFIAVMSGIIASLYGISLFYESKLLSPTLINFLNLVMILSLFFALEKGQEKGVKKYWFIAGIFMGFSSLIRPNIVMFIPFLLLLLIIDIFTSHKLSDFSQYFRNFIIFCFGIFLTILPILIRNYYFDKKIGLTSSSGGMNLYIGNNENADGFGEAPPFVAIEQGKMQLSFKEEAERRLNKKINNWAEVSSYWSKEAIKWITNNPIKFILLVRNKITFLFTAIEPPGNFPLFLIEKSKKLAGIPLFHWGIIAPLGLMGAAITIHKVKITYWFLIYIYVVMYILSNIIFFVRSEYRFPLVPIFIIFSSLFVYWLFEKIQQRKYKILSITIVLSIVLVILSNMPKVVVEDESTTLYNNSVILANRGMKEKAIEEYKKAIKINPKFFAAKENLGLLYFERKQYQEALEQFQEILKIEPSNLNAQYSIAVINYGSGNYEKAEKIFNEISKTGYKSGQVFFYLGTVNFSKGNYSTAITYFKNAIKVSSKDREELAECHLRLGNVYGKLGMNKEALTEFENAVSLSPNNFEMQRNLGITYLMSGKRDDALKHIKICLKLNSKDELVKKILEKEFKDYPLQ